MKKFLFIFILALFSGVYAQSNFYVEVENISDFGSIGDELVFAAHITNTSSSELTLSIIRTSEDMPEGWSSALCFDACFAPFVDTINTTEEFFSSPLAPGETREVSLHIFAMTNDGTGSAGLTIEEIGNSQESFSADFYATTELAAGESAFEVTAEHSTLTDTLGSEMIFEYHVKNTSTVPLVLGVARLENNIFESWSSALCFDACFAPFVDTILTTEEFGSTPIEPGETRELSLHVFPMADEGTGYITIKIENLSIADDSYTYNVEAIASDEPVSSVFSAIPEHTALTDTLNSEIIFNIEVENTSGEELVLEIIRTVNNIPESWSSALCFDACFAPFVDTIATTEEFASTPLSSGETRELSLHVFPMVNTGTGVVELMIRDKNNPSDGVTMSFNASAQITSVEDAGGVVSYSLNQNYPNPFNPSTVISFGLEKSAFTRVVVYDILGKEVSVLINEELNAGQHEVTFNADNLTSGVYIYRIISESFTETKKMILEK